jgi:hypothetical protein
MVLLQIAEKALETSPYNSLAYGVLVSILIVACGALWLRLQAADKLGRENFEKLAELMAKFFVTLEDSRFMTDAIKEGNSDLKHVVEKLERLINDFYKRFDKLEK